jgi:hypothetical protein
MKDLIKSFKNCAVGQLVRVNDVDLLIQLDDVKAVPDFLIKEKREYSRNLSDYVILTLDHIGTDYEYILVCSTFQDACDVYLYCEPDFYTPDKREILMEGEHKWLFDNQNYPAEIYCDDIVFKKKVQNELFGKTCIVEWTTDAQIVDYNIMLIETGVYNDGGGWVEYYEGRQINDKDILF